MKTTLRTTATVLAGLLGCQWAHAQSNVTLYGIIDAGLNYTSDAQTVRNGSQYIGKSQYAFKDGGAGGQDGSRFGMLGSEDLGGGISAIFRLEAGFSVADGTMGQGGTEFGRQAWVGLQAPSGTYTFGRQYDSETSFVQPFVAAAKIGGYMGAHPGDIDNFYGTRINNSVKYVSPDLKGFSFSGLYSFGGVAGSIGANQVWSMAAGYKSGPFAAAVGYANARNPNFSFYGTSANSGKTVTSNNVGSVGSATSVESNPVVAGYASAHTKETLMAGASYAIGDATIGLSYSNVRFDGLGDTASSGPNPFNYSGNVVFNNGEISLRYQVTPALMAIGAYNYTHTTGANDRTNATYHQGELGAAYFLSKRTDIYAMAVYQHASGTDSLNQPAVAAINAQTAAAGSHQLAVRIGLEQRF